MLRRDVLPATFSNERGSSGMKTFLKVFLILLLALVALKFLPFVLVPFLIGGLGLLLAVALAFGGLATAAGVGLAVLAAIVAVLAVVVAVLSPIWIPVLAVMGLLALLRRPNRITA
jgi:hypothetical protein